MQGASAFVMGRKMEKLQTFVDVILPLSVAGSFTYLLPEVMAEGVCEGCRVVVPFGMRRYYTAIVARVHHTRPEGYELKEVMEVLGERPLLLPVQLRFWEWLSDYYLCAMGDVYKAALPSGLKLESETVVVRDAGFEGSGPLPKREQQVLDCLLLRPEQRVTDLAKACGMKDVLPVVRALLEKKAVAVKEELKGGYKPKVEMRVRLAEAYRGEEALHRAFDALARAHKQLAVLMKYVELSGVMGSGEAKEVSRKELEEKSGASSAIIKSLVDRGLFEAYPAEVGRLRPLGQAVAKMNPLNRAQQEAFDGILECFRTKNVCLLHGVTASGKTEIYIHLIQKAIDEGKQVLYLLPEIALTTQIMDRLRRIFGDRLGVYHSKFPDAERVEIWRKQLEEDCCQVILGVRSSVFLPFRNLGMVIVDEEHEVTYKQQDPAPRYHARDAAIMLATYYGAKVLLGTATPSIETYHNAMEGKYGYVSLAERYRDVLLPQIVPVDVKDLRRRKQMKGAFSPLLIEKMQEALAGGEQVILFQNRRGFAPMVECRTCGWVPRCKNCDVSLTYHKGSGKLVCHYCGYAEDVPRKCPACEGSELLDRGFGTEKVEDEVRVLFPDAVVARMDLDTTRSRYSYERILSGFAEGKTHILIGTQMVSKGLDFDRVSVVGILDADTMLNYPDFRSYERAFQLMAQVAGRAGRKGRQGLVLLQTRSADHPAIGQVIRNDYRGMYEAQVAERMAFRYPPFFRLVYVYLKHRDDCLLGQMAEEMAGRLRTVFGARVLGPDKPPVARVQTFYIRKIMLKVERGASMRRVRECLREVRQAAQADGRFRSLNVYYDVDPV